VPIMPHMAPGTDVGRIGYAQLTPTEPTGEDVEKAAEALT
jgi:hypothetical protein